MRAHLTTLALVLTLAGCFTGPSAESFRPARSPRGVTVELRLASQRLRGELLEVRDTAFVVSRTAGIALVRFRDVRSASFQQMSLRYEGRRAPSAALLQQMRRVSRFPSGLPPEGWRTLLAAARQDTFQLYPR